MSALTSSSTTMQLDLSDVLETAAAPTPASSPQQVIVKLNQIQASSELDTLKQSLGIKTLETTQTLGFELWEMPDTVSIDSLNQLKASGTGVGLESVEYLQSNYKLSVTTSVSDTVNSTTTNDPDFSELWGLENQGQTGGTVDADIDAPEAWTLSTGQDVVVAVIDSGVDYTHPDLIQNMWINTGEIAGNGIDDDGNGFIDDYHGYDFVNNDGDPFDDDGHGTHVAGTIAAVGDNDTGIVGVAPDAKIMALKFLDASGAGSTFDAIQAIEYAILMGADITNNSWGGGGYSSALQEAIAAANDAGQLFVAAAGNSASNIDFFPSYPASYDLDNIISVASTDDNDSLSSFSNYGATSVDLAAPGSDIYSTIPGGGYASFNGTSMASPHVAGVAALLLAQNPDLTPAELKQKILDTVDPLDSLQGLTVSGGRLNAYSALTDGDSPSPDPIPDPTPSPDPNPRSWDFESGTLDRWNSFGDNEVTDSRFGIDPTEGDYQGLVTSGVESLSGQALEAAIAIPDHSLSRLGRGRATEGSAIQLADVTVEAGDTLTFDWNFLSDEAPNAFSKDFGFVAIGDQLIKLADASDPTLTNGGTFDYSTGYATFSYTFDADATLEISVGVVDVGSAALDSGLLIDDVQISSSANPTATSSTTSEQPASLSDELIGRVSGVLLDEAAFEREGSPSPSSIPLDVQNGSSTPGASNVERRDFSTIDTILAALDGFSSEAPYHTIEETLEASLSSRFPLGSTQLTSTHSNSALFKHDLILDSALPNVLPEVL